MARWVDPVRGIIPPSEFIPTFEKYHLLYQMDLYIFEQVCVEVRRRYDAGLLMMPVSVNFARQDFDHADIASELDRIIDKYDLSRYGIDKSFFIIEITEQDMATGRENIMEQLRRIRSSGFTLWLDDFGSGYSSINVLFSRFDVDLVKFDLELLQHLDDHNGVNREILRSMVSLARRLGIHALAEGVETEEQRDFLKEIGCEFAQGYLFYHPEPLDTILYRLSGGQRVKPFETKAERDTYDNTWHTI
ncbi:MAG: EAL domain-containing protein [Clostridia bacterium]|nr:EAL domain-containing protein [Clostridia bacterium]